MSERRYADLKRFREVGFLQELNRLFLHPLGYALEFIVDDESGECSISGIWKSGDPAGIIFDEKEIEEDLEERKKKATYVKAVWSENTLKRFVELGFVIQPVDGKTRSLFEL